MKANRLSTQLIALLPLYYCDQSPCLSNHYGHKFQLHIATLIWLSVLHTLTKKPLVVLGAGLCRAKEQDPRGCALTRPAGHLHHKNKTRQPARVANSLCSWHPRRLAKTGVPPPHWPTNKTNKAAYWPKKRKILYMCAAPVAVRPFRVGQWFDSIVSFSLRPGWTEWPVGRCTPTLRGSWRGRGSRWGWRGSGRAKAHCI